MNEFFSFRKQINIKKLVIAGIIIALIVVVLSFFFISKIKVHNEEKQIIEEENANPNTIFTSIDNSFSIELSKTYKLIQTPDNYLLSLRSNDNLGVHISRMQNSFGNKDLKLIVTADRLAYSQSFNRCSNLSELKEILVGNTTGFTYSFHYLDSDLNEAFYLQIIWLQIGDEIYIFDIDMPLDNLQFYTNIVIDTLSSFKKI